MATDGSGAPCLLTGIRSDRVAPRAGWAARLIVILGVVAPATVNSLVAQSTAYPVLQPVTCSAADALLGPPHNEPAGRLFGYYDSRRDSTYLIVYHKSAAVRSFVPYSTLVHAGAGPFDFVGILLGFNVILDSRALDPLKDSLPVKLVLDDFTTLTPGRLRIGKQFGGSHGVQQLSVLLTRAAALALVHSRSALVDWGRGHADLEASDIGLLRAFVRVQLCAPAGIPRPQLGGVKLQAPELPNAASTIDATLDFGAESIGHSIAWQSSCQKADSILGPRIGEENAKLTGEFDAPTDSTRLRMMFEGPIRRGESRWYTVHTHLAGRGPFALPELRVTTETDLFMSARHWPDTISVPIRLDTLSEGRVASLLVGERRKETPTELTLVISQEDLVAVLSARKALFAWSGMKVEWGPGQIGALRAFERALFCAPQSIEANR